MCRQHPGDFRRGYRQVLGARLRDCSLVAVAALACVGVVPLAAGQATSASAVAPAASPTPADFYGAWVLVPPLVTIVLAIVLRQVIPALAIGILVAAGMIVGAGGATGVGQVGLKGLTLAIETYLIGALTDVDHMKIIVFTFMIGAMVGIIAANGGTPAIVSVVARWASNRRRGQIATWVAGLLVFFDDYANAMIVGPAMRPVCDRLRISRAKLAYIVDSTAAPVSSIALIGTWIGAEIGFIHDGLSALSTTPSFLQGCELDKGFAYSVFFNSIPYRFYPILALVMVLLIGWLDRDFGPMRRAERELPSDDQTAAPRNDTAALRARAWQAAVPVLVLVLVTLGLLILTGWLSIRDAGPLPTGFDLIQQIVSSADSYTAILYGALAAVVSAAAITLVTRTLTLTGTMDAATTSMSRMFPTMVVLSLAWALSAAMQDLQLGEVARRLLEQASFDAQWLPLLVFATSCVVSFATGTSWGTMGILCPAAVTIAAGLLGDVPTPEAMPLFYASVGAVLAGAVFGDHCSPISDTTVLSALASECKLESHVWTQMPYALVVAGVSIVCGDILCRELGLPVWSGLLIGSVALWVVLLVAGRRPGTPPIAEGPRTAP